MGNNQLKQSGFREREYMYNFKASFKELIKDHSLTISAAEKKMGFKTDFFEEVFRGINELTLYDVCTIAKFFNTTMDSVLNGNGNEIRIKNDYYYDRLESQYFEECVQQYVALLDIRAMEFRRAELFKSRILDSKVKLENKESIFFERYKVYMDEFEREKIQPLDAKGICDEVLITELQQRGFTIERK